MAAEFDTEEASLLLLKLKLQALMAENETVCDVIEFFWPSCYYCYF